MCICEKEYRHEIVFDYHKIIDKNVKMITKLYKIT